MDTIVALSTPPGRGGVAVIRVSGPLVSSISLALLKKMPKPRYATFSSFYDLSNETIDQGIALFFKNPHSFTGEDVLELHAHGGSIIVDCIIQVIVQSGARLARPGEFSERAFLNNKIDLVQAEAIADLIDASSIQAARAAIHSLQGEFSKHIHALVKDVIWLRTYVEASIDFVDEDIDHLNDKKIELKLKELFVQLKKIQGAAKQGSLLRDGIKMVIAGSPNVGKSSLLNQLTGKDRAIVTDIPGTTRDVLHEHILIDGIPIHVMDTAGLRTSLDPVEEEGIRRAKAEIEKADIIVWVSDIQNREDFFIPEEIKNEKSIPIIFVQNKMDLINQASSLVEKEGHTEITLSAKSGAGIDLLKNEIKRFAGVQSTEEGLFSARRRHVDALKRTESFLEMGLKEFESKSGELLAENLRLAQLALNDITGEFTSDDLLGVIFSSFCIGK